MIKIYSDGAATMKCIDGEYQRGNGGWAWAAINNDELIKADYDHQETTTNNRMELTAILMALKAYKNERNIDIYSDSAYCVNMLKEKGWIYSWANNNWTRGKKHEPIENIDIIKQIYEYLQNGNISFYKVTGHSINKWNNFVDKLAVEGKTGNIRNEYIKSLDIINEVEMKNKIIKDILEKENIYARKF